VEGWSLNFFLRIFIMALPKIGDGEQVGDGNTGEVLNVGRTGQSLQFGGAASTTIGFYGATPVVQRATSTTHSSTNVVTSASYGTLQVAQMQEVVNTLVALGIWAA
jgi:hypothetical protein